jgi:broad specificity phosphatase PhoE
MLTIILTRHGQTDLNKRGIFRGRIDVGLNDTGIRQAQSLADYLQDKGVTRIYCSPLRRATKTAEIISARCGVAAKATPELIDLDHGEWQGLPHAVVQEKYPEMYSQWLNHPESAQIPGGESLDGVLNRTKSLLESILANDRGKTLLVSHRAVNRIILCHLLGLDNSHFWNFEFDSCALTTFNYDAYGHSRFILVRHNDDFFLGRWAHERKE